MVEAGLRGRTRFEGAPLCVHQNVVRLHADLGEHGTEYGRLVFAVSVFIAEDVAGGMRPPASDSNADLDISNVMLGEMSKSLDALHRRLGCGREIFDLLLQRRGRISHSAGEARVPGSEIRPR